MGTDLVPINADPRELLETSSFLVKLQGDLNQGVTSAVHAANATLARVRYAVARATEEHRAAHDALAACYRSSDMPDCSALAARAKRATESLERAQSALRIVDSAIESFNGPRLRFEQRSQELVASGTTFLKQRHQQLEEMSKLQGTVSGGRASAPSKSRANGLPPASQSQPIVSTLAGLPAGIHIVPLALIDMNTCGVTSAADFRKGYSPRALAWAFDAFDQVVVPGLAEGKTEDDFARMDQLSGRFGAMSYSDTFSNFLNPKGDAIRLSMQPNGKYEIKNGQHRVWVAVQMGRVDVPAVVVT